MIFLSKESQLYFLFQYWCCGAKYHYQWNETVWFTGGDKGNATTTDKLRVPDSCCKPPIKKGCGEVTHPSNINYKVLSYFLSYK
jgi:hypothetical protein